MKKVSLFLFICILTVSAMDIHSQHINGPVSSSSSKGVRPEIFTTYAFSFKGNSRVLSDSYGNNAASMSALLERVEAERSRIGSGEFKIGVSSNTASSGNEKKALRLARSRALVVKSFLIKKAGLRKRFSNLCHCRRAFASGRYRYGRSGSCRRQVFRRYFGEK